MRKRILTGLTVVAFGIMMFASGVHYGTSVEENQIRLELEQYDCIPKGTI